jgi:branched-chain amino acid transport system substrate-binding protein
METISSEEGVAVRMRLWIAAALILSLLGCVRPDPIRIGFVGGTSGRVADLGIAGRDSVQLAIERCNQEGGINGRPVQLITRDDEQNPEKAVLVVKELIDQRVVAIIGPMTSSMGTILVPIANEAGVLLMSPTVTTEELSGKDDHFFRVSSTTREYAARSARYQLKSGAMRRVAAVYDLGNRSFTENWLRNFQSVFVEGGGQIIRELGFESGGETNYLQLAGEVLAAQPEGVLIVANSMDSAILCQQFRKLDAEIPITLADWGATERLIELGGRAVEGVTVVQTFDRNCSAPAYQTFRKLYMERFHREPGFPGVYSYDAVSVVLEALRKQQPGQSLKEVVLARRSFQGLQNPFSFDAYGDVQRPQASISVVRNGDFAVLE